MESVESQLLHEIIPFDIIRMIATYLKYVDHWSFRHACKTTMRLLPRTMEIEIKLRSYAFSPIEDLSLPFNERRIMEFDECDVICTKRAGVNGAYRTFDFTMQKRRAKIIIYDNRSYCDYYGYSFYGTRKGIWVIYSDKEKIIQITIMENKDTHTEASKISSRESLNIRAFPSFKDCNMYLWNAVKDTEFGQRNMSLFQEILN